MSAPDSAPFALPDRIAIDAKGYGWRQWDDEEMWSMVPTNPDNSPIPQPVTWFVLVPSKHEADLDAVATALGTNGFDRLMELVGEDNRPEATSCLTGIVRAVVADLIEGMEAALPRGGSDR